jgi:hypothetical protein
LVPEATNIISADALLPEIKITPNPFKARTRFIFDPISGNSSVDIYGIDGVLIESIQIPEGENSVLWEPTNLNGGIYIAVQRVGSKVIASNKVVLLN